MVLIHDFEWARRFLSAGVVENRHPWTDVCLEIREAERSLNRAAGSFLTRCQERCHGLCCRNVYLNEIIGREDWVFLLTLAPELGPEIERRLARLDPIFTADCIFLRKGKGPCLFPEDLRPEVCITSFCMNTPALSADIRSVKWGFVRLAWSLRRHHIHMLISNCLPLSGK